jgi:hypothetical protein
MTRPDVARRPVTLELLDSAGVGADEREVSDQDWSSVQAFRSVSHAARCTARHGVGSHAYQQRWSGRCRPGRTSRAIGLTRHLVHLGSAAFRNFKHGSWPLAGRSRPPATARGIEGGGGFLGGLLVSHLIGRAGDDQ